MAADTFNNPTLNLQTDFTPPTNFLLQSGTITGPRNLIISGTFDWVQTAQPAFMSGSGQTIVTSTGTLNIGGGGSRSLCRTGRKLVNAGTINFTADGNLSMTESAIIDNRATGVFDIQSDFGVTGGAAQTLINAGLIKDGRFGNLAADRFPE